MLTMRSLISAPISVQKNCLNPSDYMTSEVMLQNVLRSWHGKNENTMRIVAGWTRGKIGKESMKKTEVQPTKVKSLFNRLEGVIWKQTVAMFSAGAVLGPLLDGQHSHYNVLHYTVPQVFKVGAYQLETCWWVPLLFGLAAVILGVSHPILDIIDHPEENEPIFFKLPTGCFNPSWSFVYAGIALFAIQYALSGLMANEAAMRGDSSHYLADFVLLSTGVLHWWTFDRTRGGFCMAILTAMAGPIVEISLINGFELYHYTHPDVLGIPTWIPWVYFCGSPAVGNLGRKVFAQLEV